jgi:hypothetical protein
MSAARCRLNWAENSSQPTGFTRHRLLIARARIMSADWGEAAEDVAVR